MGWKTYGAVAATTLALGAGGAAATDAQINTLEDRGDRFERILANDIPNAGLAKAEMMKNEPKVVLSKWNDEVRLGVSYNKVKGKGNRPAFTNRAEWKDPRGKEEVHAYPIDDQHFEIEVVLNEKPDTNVFEFQIEGAEDLDFFYQPELTPEEIAEGADRPENVIGSYAVYHKTKANHRIGDTNYATGKAFHIYRPKAIDANGAEVWAELNYDNGVLSVSVPQKFLDDAVYPVRVDPTFGYTMAGASNGALDGIEGSVFSTTEAGDVTKLTVNAKAGPSSGGTIGVAVYSDNSTAPNAKLAEDSGNATLTTSFSWYDLNLSYNVTGSTAYWLIGWPHRTSGLNVPSMAYDTGGSTNQGRRRSAGITFETWPDPFGTSLDADPPEWIFSIYATYTASGGGGGTAAPANDLILFE